MAMAVDPAGHYQQPSCVYRAGSPKIMSAGVTTVPPAITRSYSAILNVPHHACSGCGFVGGNAYLASITKLLRPELHEAASITLTCAATTRHPSAVRAQ